MKWLKTVLVSLVFSALYLVLLSSAGGLLGSQLAISTKIPAEGNILMPTDLIFQFLQNIWIQFFAAFLGILTGVAYYFSLKRE